MLKLNPYFEIQEGMPPVEEENKEPIPQWEEFLHKF